MPKRMTSGERLWAALSLREPDRVPIWMLYPRERLGYYVDVHAMPSYARIVPYVWDRTDWLDRRNIDSGTFYTAAADVEVAMRTEMAGRLPGAPCTRPSATCMQNIARTRRTRPAPGQSTTARTSRTWKRSSRSHTSRSSRTYPPFTRPGTGWATQG